MSPGTQWIEHLHRPLRCNVANCASEANSAPNIPIGISAVTSRALLVCSRPANSGCDLRAAVTTSDAFSNYVHLKYVLLLVERRSSKLLHMDQCHAGWYTALQGGCSHDTDYGVPHFCKLGYLA